MIGSTNTGTYDEPRREGLSGAPAPRITVIEDDGPIRNMLSITLTEIDTSLQVAGIDVAGNVEEALEVSRNAAGVVLLDINLRGKSQNGQELVSIDEIRDPEFAAFVAKNNLPIKRDQLDSFTALYYLCKRVVESGYPLKVIYMTADEYQIKGVIDLASQIAQLLGAERMRFGSIIKPFELLNLLDAVEDGLKEYNESVAS